MKRHIKTSHTVIDFYNYYLTEVEGNSIYVVDFKTYKQIIIDYFKHLSNELLLNSKLINLHGLGNLSIIKKRPKNLNGKSLCVDFKLTKEIGKTVYHLNEHSGGFKYRFYWSRKNNPIVNRGMYELVATRANKRLLAKLIKEKQTDYIEM